MNELIEVLYCHKCEQISATAHCPQCDGLTEKVKMVVGGKLSDPCPFCGGTNISYDGPGRAHLFMEYDQGESIYEETCDASGFMGVVFADCADCDRGQYLVDTRPEKRRIFAITITEKGEHDRYHEEYIVSANLEEARRYGEMAAQELYTGRRSRTEMRGAIGKTWTDGEGTLWALTGVKETREIMVFDTVWGNNVRAHLVIDGDEAHEL